MLFAMAASFSAADSPKQLIAHRGASGYRPEHTFASYRLAMEQHADFVEPDLAVSKDGVLICLHDDTLERTTNIADVFPDRASANVPDYAQRDRRSQKHWLANDFTIAMCAGLLLQTPVFGPTRIAAVRALMTRTIEDLYKEP